MSSALAERVAGFGLDVGLSKSKYTMPSVTSERRSIAALAAPLSSAVVAEPRQRQSACANDGASTHSHNESHNESQRLSVHLFPPERVPTRKNDKFLLPFYAPPCTRKGFSYSGKPVLSS